MTYPLPPTFVRVRVYPNEVCLSGLEVDLMDQYGLKTRYESVDSLPKWIQDKLRKLQIMPVPPPPLEVNNIGQRISDNTFWVYV